MKMRAQGCNLEIRVPAVSCGDKVRPKPGLFNLLAILMLVLALIGLSSCAGLTSNASGGGNPGSPSTGVLSPNSSSLSFGNVSIGNTPTKSLTVTNTGTAAVNISQATITGTGFTAVSGNGSTSIPVGQSATIQIQFAPKATGAATGSLSIVSDASNSPLNISLSGIGVEAGLTMTPSSVNFGSVTVGQTNTQTVKLTNSGNTDVMVSSAATSGSGFSFSGLNLPGTLGVSQSVSFTVQFHPAGNGESTGSVSFTDNSPASPQVLALSGTGVSSTELLSANPTTLSFGNVNDGSNSTLNVTLTNNGNADITISGVTTSGTGFSANGVSPGLVLGPTQAATLHVLFSPSSAGTAAGSVKVSSNATNSPAAVALAGTGVQTNAESVSLNWTSSSSSGVTGYNVYRGTTQGSYSRVNSSQVPGTGYTDSSVQSGQNITYYYVVTAVNSSNEESTDSNVASAQVP